MAKNSKIEWTDHTWNPITGCTPISEGCRNCYARRIAKRFRGRFGYPEDEPFRVTFHPDRLHDPLKWGKPRRIFVCSMGDLFHEEVPYEFVDKVFAVTALCPQHDFLILTKRPQQMCKYFIDYPSIGDDNNIQFELTTHFAWESAKHWGMSLIRYCDMVGVDETQASPECILDDTPPVVFPLSNLSPGVTAENQRCADERIPILLQIPAAIRWVSLEPLLSEIDISEYLRKAGCHTFPDGESFPYLCLWEGRQGRPFRDPCPGWPPLDWVVIGCETGPHRRPCKLEWVRGIIEQCDKAGVPVFVKQLEINGKVSHTPEDWPEWARRREFPTRVDNALR